MADSSLQDGSYIDTTTKDGRAESDSCLNNEKNGILKKDSLFSQSHAQISGGQVIALDGTTSADKVMELHGFLAEHSYEHSCIPFTEDAVANQKHGNFESAKTAYNHIQQTEHPRMDAESIALQREHEQEILRSDDCQETTVDMLNRYDDNSTSMKLAGRLTGQYSASMNTENENFVTVQSRKEEKFRQSEYETDADNRPSESNSDGCAETNTRFSKCNVSLRQWLSNPGRVIDKVETLHIFRQIVEFVELAHSQGVVLRNIRPSSFILSPLSRVSIIDSASTRTSSGSSEQSTGRAVPGSLADSFEKGDGLRSLGGLPTCNIREDSQINSQCADISEDLKPAHGKEFGTIAESSTVLSIVHVEEMRQTGGSFGVTNDLQWPTKTVSPCGHNSTSSDSEKSEGRQHDMISSEEKTRAAFQPCSSDERPQPRDEKFPLKQILCMEQMCYKSLEEIAGGTPDFYTDVYSLGILFFELFNSSGSEEEWSRAMCDLRHRLLPPSLLLNHPKEAAFCLWLLHPDPRSRPTARELLNADIFSEVGDKLAEREAIMNLEEKEAETETTLEFLLQMQQEKHEIFHKVSQEFQSLTSDIEEVERRQALLKQNMLWDKRLKDSFDENIKNLTNSKVDTGRPSLPGNQTSQLEDSQYSSHSGDQLQERRRDLFLTRHEQLMRNFIKFKQIYVAMKQTSNHLGTDNFKQNIQAPRVNADKQDVSRSSANLSVEKSEHVYRGDHLGLFLDSLSKFISYSRFKVKATLQHGDLLNTGNMVCSLSFDCNDEFFATAGVCRKIKVFEYSALLEESRDIHYPMIEMTSRGKLSCVCWNYFSKSHLASSDLEGSVQLWDVTRGRTFMDFKEHARRAWSVDFSHYEPLKLASGSDDCCVKLWSMNQGASVGTIKMKANVCCVQFPPDSSHRLVFGSADRNIYCHDLRYMRFPMCILRGHNKSVSFVRFVDSVNIISASTDNTLKLWDLTKASVNVRNACMTTFTGHTNEKNFVGLSVGEGGYIACGSETNEVFAYHKSLPMTMLSHKFGYADPISGQEVEDARGQFVSSVCWRGKSQTLVAANSLGNIKVLEMV